MVMPQEFMDLLARHPKALQAFELLNKAQKYAIYWSIATAKTDKSRQNVMTKQISKLEDQ